MIKLKDLLKEISGNSLDKSAFSAINQRAPNRLSPQKMGNEVEKRLNQLNDEDLKRALDFSIKDSNIKEEDKLNKAALLSASWVLFNEKDRPFVSWPIFTKKIQDMYKNIRHKGIFSELFQLCKIKLEDFLNKPNLKTQQVFSESFKQGKGWQVYEGTSHISTIFENGRQIAFELTFRNKKGDEKDKWRKQAAGKWATIAREIFNNPELNEIGNPKLKSWEECFQEALMDERMKPFIRESDRTPVFDPVNFTPRV